MADEANDLETPPGTSDFSESDAPRRPLAELNAVEVSDSTSTCSKRKKKAKKKHRKCSTSSSPQRSTTRHKSNADHNMSDSDNSAEFDGFVPVYSTAPPKKTQLPPWLNANVPPGPWHMMGPYQPPYPPFWQPYPYGPASHSHPMDIPAEEDEVTDMRHLV